jgi:stage IV sporulation protein FB
MIGEPLNSPYDVNFKLFDFRVRVTWLFWVVAAAFGYNICMATHESYENSPGVGVLLAIWIACMFVSILVHELGHSLAMRYYGLDSYIVLYHFGGLAVPTTFQQYGRSSRTSRSSSSQLVISLAGPIAQFLLGVLFMVIAYSQGYYFAFADWLPLIGINIDDLNNIPNPSMYALINFMIWPSIAWALFNMLPVIPLDGGRVFQHSATMYLRRNALYEATVVSIVVGILTAIYGFQTQQMFIGLMFMSLAYSNYQNLRGDIGGF